MPPPTITTSNRALPLFSSARICCRVIPTSVQKGFGIEAGAWVKAIRQRTDGAHAQFAFFYRQEGGVVLANPVLVTDGSPVADDQFRGSVFQMLPSGHGFRVGIGYAEHIGCVDGTTLSVEMGQVGEHVGSFSVLTETFSQIALNSIEQVVDVIPVCSRFQGVYRIAHLPERLPEVGHGKALFGPLGTKFGACINTTMGTAHFLGLSQGGTALGFAAGNAEGHHALAFAHPSEGQEFLQHTDQLWVAR